MKTVKNPSSVHILAIILLALVGSNTLRAQIITTNLVAQYAMTDATGTNLPDSSGNANNGTLLNSPAVGALGVGFSRASSQSASLPSGLSTTVKTIQIFADCDRYLQAGTPSALLGNSTATGSRIYCGMTISGVNGVNKSIVLDGGTTLSGTITNSQNTMTVADAARVPNGYYFRLDSEAIICSGNTSNLLTGCSRAQLGSTAVTHSSGAPAVSNANSPNNTTLNGNTGDLGSYFSAISPSMLSIVFDPANSRILDNGTETVYGGFYSLSSVGFTVASNTGQWSLGGEAGEYFNGKIYYVLMYTSELTNVQIQQNVTAVNAILTARGMSVNARTDGAHAANILLVEGTSIDNYWAGTGMTLTSTLETHVTAQSGIDYGSINGYTVARDGPLTNPTAARNAILLGAPTNDLAGNTLAGTETNFSATVTTVKGEGWTEVYCGTMLSRTGTTASAGTWDVAHDAYNTWLRANWASIGCTNIFDPAANPSLGADGAYANTTYFGDGVHPTSAGNAIYALAAQTAINNGYGSTKIAITAASTNTEVKLIYTAPDAAGCTITGSDQNNGPAIVDLNATLFPGAGVDITRTAANGFTPYTLIDGLTRTVFIGGKGVKLGSDGLGYSRALQPASAQQFTVACSSGYTGTVTIPTKNLRIGAGWPGDLPDFNSSFYGNIAKPAFQYDNQDYRINDPLTGAVRAVMNQPLDYTTQVNYSSPQGFQYYRDVTGSTWTSIANLIATPVSGLYASIASQNNSAFAAWQLNGPGVSWDYTGSGSVQDIQVYVKGCAGTSSSTCTGSATLSMCLSASSGAACDSAVHTVTLGSIIATQVFPGTTPGVWPKSNFGSWGPTRNWQAPNYVNVSNGNVKFNTTSGSPVVTGTAGSQTPFANDFPSGSRILLPGSGCSADSQTDVCVVSSTASSTQLTLTANAPNTVTNGVPQPLTGGIRVWLSSGAAATFSMQFVPAEGNSQNGNQSFPGWDACSDVPITNITTNRWGTPYPVGTTPLTGLLCSPGGGTTLIIPSTGEARRLSRWTVTAGSIIDGYGNMFSATDPLSMYLQSVGSGPIYKATYVPPCSGCYLEYKANPSYYGVRGAGASATATVSGGVPTVTVNSGGANYDSTIGYGPVQVRFDGGGCSGGFPVATVSSGAVTAISAAGITCTSTPTVWINSDNMTYTALTFPDIGTQLSTYAGAGSASYWYNTGLFSTPSFEGIIGGWLIYNSCATANGAGDNACLRIRVDPVSGLITQAATEFGDDPLRWGHRHAGLQGVGNIVITAETPQGSMNPSNFWGGPFVMYADKLKRNGVWTQHTIAPATCVPGTPPVCTAALNHHLDNFNGSAPGNHIGPISNVTGGTSGWIGANGQFIIVPHSGSLTQFEIRNLDGTALNGSGFGTYSGALSFTVMPAIPSCYVQSVATGPDSTAELTCSSFFASDGYHGFANGDSIAFNRSWSTSYYVKTIDTNHIELFLNANLTGSVANSAISNNSMGDFLEACPASPPARVLPPALLLDSTGAAAGIHRCVTIHVDGEPCSGYAGTTEHTFKPCPTDPSNTSRSAWLTLQVGDMFSTSTRGTDDTDAVVISKTADVPLGGFDLTVMRFWGDLSSSVNPQLYDASLDGWMPNMRETYTVSHYGTVALLDAANTANTWQPIDGGNFGGAHQDFGHGFTKGNITYAPGAVDPINNVTALQFQSWPTTRTFQSDVGFGGATSYFHPPENYTAHRVTELAPISEHSYMTDYPNYNPLNGVGGGSQGPGGSSLDNCAPTTTTFASGFSHVYDVTPCVSYSDLVNDIKRAPLVVVAGRVYLQDLSGPSSSLTDAMDSAFCYAANLNGNHECVPTSIQGHVYVAMQRIDNLGHCYGNTLDWLQPCPIPLTPWAAWGVQHETTPTDKVGSRARRLSRFDLAPTQPFAFSGIMQEPSGHLLFTNGFQIVKNTPWSGADAIGNGSLNADFDWISIPVSGDTGELVQIGFGYAGVNQDPALLYCGARREMCVSNYAYSQSVPYKWASESVSGSWTPCAGQCKVTVPGLPGEMLFYRVFRQNAAGVITSDPSLQSMSLR